MTEMLYGFPVHNDDDKDTKYSKNKLTNGNAETGNMGGWDAVDASVVPGGPTFDSDFTFKVNRKTGLMSQDLPLGGAQPPDYIIKGMYLPEDIVSDMKTHVQTYCKVEVSYAVGEGDTHFIPVMEPMAYVAVGGEGEEDAD